MNVWLNKYCSHHTEGSGSTGKFFFSSLVNQLASRIWCVCHGNNKVHRASEPWSNLGLRFCLT